MDLSPEAEDLFPLLADAGTPGDGEPDLASQLARSEAADETRDLEEWLALCGDAPVAGQGGLDGDDGAAAERTLSGRLTGDEDGAAAREEDVHLADLLIGGGGDDCGPGELDGDGLALSGAAPEALMAVGGAAGAGQSFAAPFAHGGGNEAPLAGGSPVAAASMADSPAAGQRDISVVVDDAAAVVGRLRTADAHDMPARDGRKGAKRGRGWGVQDEADGSPRKRQFGIVGADRTVAAAAGPLGLATSQDNPLSPDAAASTDGHTAAPSPAKHPVPAFAPPPVRKPQDRGSHTGADAGQRHRLGDITAVAAHRPAAADPPRTVAAGPADLAAQCASLKSENSQLSAFLGAARRRLDVAVAQNRSVVQLIAHLQPLKGLFQIDATKRPDAASAHPLLAAFGVSGEQPDDVGATSAAPASADLRAGHGGTSQPTRAVLGDAPIAAAASGGDGADGASASDAEAEAIAAAALAVNRGDAAAALIDLLGLVMRRNAEAYAGHLHSAAALMLHGQ